MNYYEHHLGDYAEATAHLSFVEDAAYSRCIRKYYAMETPLPADLKQVQRLIGARTKEEKEAVETVLTEFFTLEADGWHNDRCDRELAKYQDKRSKAQGSANARWNAKRADSERNANASETHMRTHGNFDANALRPQCEGNALQSPISNLHTPEEKNKKANALAEARAVVGLDIESFDRWIGYRAERKPAIKTASLKAAAQELAAFGSEQYAVVQHSIANGYQGLFAKKLNGNHATKQTSHAMVMAALDAAVDPNSPEEWPT